MFQSFDDPASTDDITGHLTTLRQEMTAAKVDWYMVPHADEHQNEYLPPHAERLAWLTGFTGSAGFALIGLNAAYLFVDGRYTVQAAEQVDAGDFKIHDLISEPPSKFIQAQLKTGEHVGFDPSLITIGQRKVWQKAAAESGGELAPTDALIDRIWKDQPQLPKGNAWLHPEEFAGQSAEEKLSRLIGTIKNDKATHCIITDPASIAWLFNIRGSDVVHNPLALAYALVSMTEKPTLFMDADKFSDTDRETLAGIATIKPYDTVGDALSALPENARLHADPALVSCALADKLPDHTKLVERRDPVALMRAIKNDTELAGTRSAHLRDGVAMVRFLCWLDGQKPGTVTEIEVAIKLESLRAETAKRMGSELKEIAFDTISGAGANGAIVHYRVTNATNATLQADTLYLVDSGGQYEDGTTDITRTVAIGNPPSQAVTDNTLVLKGHIAIATARFPEGIRGVDLDPLARIALWKQGRDYAHGTGHGVGSYLNVHEGPQSISKRGMEPLQSGMIVSNEPGYYKERAYGIRIENLVIVTPPEKRDNDDIAMLAFETITLCPIDLRLIDETMLSEEESRWLNAYHERVRQTLTPHLDEQEAEWLARATPAIGSPN